MKGNKHHKGDAVTMTLIFLCLFFARFSSPPSRKPQAECAGQQGECCPTDTGILMGCCHLTKNVQHCGWSVGEMTGILVSRPTVSEVSQKKLIWQQQEHFLSFFTLTFLPRSFEDSAYSTKTTTDLNLLNENKEQSM